MYVGFRNCDLDLLNWFVITFGGGIYHNKDDRPNRQPCYHWRLGVADSAQFLEWIEPYLIIKREDALRALSKYAER